MQLCRASSDDLRVAKKWTYLSSQLSLVILYLLSSTIANTSTSSSHPLQQSLWVCVSEFLSVCVSVYGVMCLLVFLWVCVSMSMFPYGGLLLNIQREVSLVSSGFGIINTPTIPWCTLPTTHYALLKWPLIQYRPRVERVQPPSPPARDFPFPTLFMKIEMRTLKSIQNYEKMISVFINFHQVRILLTSLHLVIQLSQQHVQVLYMNPGVHCRRGLWNSALRNRWGSGLAPKIRQVVIFTHAF